MRPLFFALLSALVTLSGCKDTQNDSPRRLSWTFPAEGVSKIILRSARAGQALVRTGPQTVITVSARPVLAPNGYHAPEPLGRETPAHEWTFEVGASRKGNTLLLTTKGETTFRQYRYFLDSVAIEAPSGVEVIREHQAPAQGSP